MRALRDYQLEAVEAVEGAWAEGMLRPAIVLPTGTGKTDCIARIATDAASQGRRVLALAHRGELLDQITERCKMHAPDIPVGRVQAGRNEGRRPITVAMAQTLASEKRRKRLQPPDVMIVDEAHHASSPTQMAILRWAGSFDHTPTMGVTATMVRGDRKGLGDVWQEVVFSRDIRWAVDAGWLVPPRGRAVVTDHLDLEKAKVTKGDYQDNELGDMVAQDVDQIVKAWHENACDRLTIAFTPTVASAQQLANEFRVAGVPTGEVYGSTPIRERDQTYADLRTGRIRVLVSVMVTTEGWDCPPVSCILQARPTRLPGLYTQMIGRGLRPSPDTGKHDCLVLDVVGASRRQKLVTLIDLHETNYDTSELDELPCEQCGGYTRAQVLALNLNRDEVQWCICVPDDDEEEGAERTDRRIHLIGPAQYEDVDMFRTSSLNWLFTRAGTRFLPAGERMALLWPEGEGYLPGHCTQRGYSQGVFVGRDGQWLHPEPLPLGRARELAEAWALAYDPTVSSRHSGWRRRGGRASEAQIQFAARLGIVAPETMNKPRLSDEISIALASRAVD